MSPSMNAASPSPRLATTTPGSAAQRVTIPDDQFTPQAVEAAVQARCTAIAGVLALGQRQLLAVGEHSAHRLAAGAFDPVLREVVPAVTVDHREQSVEEREPRLLGRELDDLRGLLRLGGELDQRRPELDAGAAQVVEHGGEAGGELGQHRRGVEVALDEQRGAAGAAGVALRQHRDPR